MSQDVQKTTATHILTAALACLGIVPSLLLMNTVISWFNLSSVGVGYFGLYLAMITVPVGIVLLLVLFVYQMMKAEQIHNKILFKNLSIALTLITFSMFIFL